MALAMGKTLLTPRIGNGLLDLFEDGVHLLTYAPGDAADCAAKARWLLESLEGIQISELTRPDECCGFGGTFVIGEEAVSVMMGQDRIADHESAGTEILTANDMSCLMHMDGLIRREKKPIRVMHIAEILSEAGGRS